MDEPLIHQRDEPNPSDGNQNRRKDDGKSRMRLWVVAPPATYYACGDTVGIDDIDALLEQPPYDGHSVFVVVGVIG